MNANQATDYLIKHYNAKKAGFKAIGTNYQCVGLMQEYLRQIGSFIDPILPTAYDYAKTFKTNNTHSIMGYPQGSWKVITKGFKKGDIIFYKPTPANFNAGHVAIVINSKEVLQQNVVAPFDGSYKYLTKSNINTYGIVAWGMRHVEGTQPIGRAEFQYKDKRECYFNLYPNDVMLFKTDNSSRYAHYMWIKTKGRNIWDKKTGKKVNTWKTDRKVLVYMNTETEKKVTKAKNYQDRV